MQQDKSESDFFYTNVQCKDVQLSTYIRCEIVGQGVADGYRYVSHERSMDYDRREKLAALDSIRLSCDNEKKRLSISSRLP